MTENNKNKVTFAAAGAPQRRINTLNSHLNSDGYRYTLPQSAGILTKEQRDHYEKHGFIIIRNLVSAKDCDRYAQHFRDVVNGVKKPEPTMLVMKDIAVARGLVKGDNIKGEYAIAKFQDFQDDPVLFDYCKKPEILRYVSCFTGPNIKSMHTMLINKPPNMGISSTHPLHQDLHYFPFRPEDRIVCSWTAMQTVNQANGCLVVIPGSHKGELLRHGYPSWEGRVNEMYHEIEGANKEDVERVYAEMNVGDTIFFHPLLIHGSGPNTTSGFRKAISCHYASANCEYIDVKGTIQENISKEVEQIAKKKFGADVPFDFIWRIRSRLVAGEEGTL